ncbi:membrane-associated protease RseP (regulator of RpoE activity) [Kribbella orskensis]|uniref:Membrane-associated protease RseP (Regulator of RpoE activity) n=1 Tax=Kribbella orskensis TaxID=2512216 RepID=A0ABY2BS82_9ACTN|nr:MULTISPECIES: M50 family metallopeptidase [Kribbella]TCN43165.1 membrane-associated protease RseP (regulator of RpoE activity) [Kribbella sp. VKM Ac-2500]TCO29479.1 membrane-associated protease RseP (regulator of RpoE activity) [Kribbella orskensis]
MSALLTLIGVVLFVVGILASVALHEMGHMLPAKAFGMKVTQFFVGFGRTVWSTKRGETEYGFKLIPAGGFVRIIGMMPPAKGQDPSKVRKANTGPIQSLVENARSAEYETIDPADDGRLFYQKVWWKKLIVMASGPLVNVAIAFGLFTGLFMLYGTDVPQTTVATVTDCVIPADQASADRKCQPADKESPAKAAGFQVGDKILSFNGTTISSWDDLTPLIRANTDKPAVIVVERNGQQTRLQTNTILNQVVEKAGSDKIVSVGFLGVSPEQKVERQDFGFVVDKMGELTVATVKALGNFPEKLVGVAKSIVGGDRDQDSPMSVVGASRVAGEVASNNSLTGGERIAFLISLLASLNLFLALFNFIPLLPLDGGHMIGAIWEGIRRGFAKLFGRPDPGYVDVAKLLPIAYVAASFIVVMGVLLVIADIVNPIKLFNG